MHYFDKNFQDFDKLSADFRRKITILYRMSYT